ncbi:MAG: ABC transporter ATP-binding protein [Actinobacteria bacterium]|nr:ABC transporter ATP-binding protein [Actinomycetota bacterium]
MPTSCSLDEEPRSPFEPVGVVPQYAPPRASVDADTSKGWLRRLWPVVRSHRFLLFSSVATALLAMVSQIAAPAVIAGAIDQALQNRTRPLLPYALVLVALGLTRGVFSLIYRYGLYKMAYRIENDLRVNIYRHLTRLSFGFYDRIQSGQIISRANSDIRSVQMFLAFAPMIGLSVLSFFVALAVMLKISVSLTLVSIVCLPGVYLLGMRLRSEIFPLSWIIQSRTADIATLVDENVNGVRVVKSFAQEKRQIQELSRAARRLQWANVRAIESRAAYTPIMENLPRVGLVIVLLYGGWLVIGGQLQLGVLVAFNAYIVMMQVPFRLLGFFMMLQQRAAASAGRIFEILDETPEIVDAPGAVDLTDIRGRVELRDVRFGYGGNGQATMADILDGFSLAVEPGETVAIVGRTGSGKSTITRLLPRFYDAREGAVLVDGHDVRDVTLLSLRANIGLVLDEPFLFSATVRENIAYGRPDATLDEIVAAARAAQAHEFVQRLPDGYDSVIGERGYTLSGGQRQRIAIARTLLVNPKILVLDDATSAIDVQIESEIHAALEALLENRTTIVIAHRLSTIALADRIVLVEGGRAVAAGTHLELMATEPRYVEALARAEQDDHGAPEADDRDQDEDGAGYRMRIGRRVAVARGDGSGDGPPGGFAIGGIG